MATPAPGLGQRLLERLRSLVESPADAIVLALCAAFVFGWALRAWQDNSPADFFSAYVAGQVSWLSGHPEVLQSWTGTPLLAVLLMLVTRLVGLYTGSALLTALNVVVFLGGATAILAGLRERLPRRVWWLVALALCSFGPVMSTVWWKQINLIALALAAGGYALMRRGQGGGGAALIGASVAFKPLAVLLPLALLLRRETRRTGLLALGWIAGLSMAALAVLAWRAHSVAVLNPYRVYENFSAKVAPHVGYACFPDNFAPTATLCRAGGAPYIGDFRVFVLLAAALVAAWVVEGLRGRGLPSWDAFAFTCLLSLLVSPISWNHYQVMLVPLFLVLLVRFCGEGAPLGLWLGLIAAYGLASLDWQPYGTLIHSVGDVLGSGRLPDRNFFETPWLTATEAVAQLAQYVLLLTGLLWYWRGAGATRGSPGEAARSTAS